MGKPTLLKGLNLSEMSQTVDLREITGVDLSARPGLKEAIGQALIDKMKDRTASNEFVKIDSGAQRYSDSYAESDEFKARGKSKGNVNMKLTGDMLSALEVLETSGNSIKLGFDDPEEREKAGGHNRGDNKVLPLRQFFGLRQSEVKEVIGRFSSEIQETKKLNQRTEVQGETTRSRFESARSILDFLRSINVRSE